MPSRMRPSSPTLQRHRPAPRFGLGSREFTADARMVNSICPEPYDTLNAFGSLAQISGDV